MEKKKDLQQREGYAFILSPFPLGSGCHPAGQESRGLSQLTAVPAWSSHWTEGTAVLPPQLAGLGMREEKQACLRVRGVLQYLPYNEQIELKHQKTFKIMWCICKSLYKGLRVKQCHQHIIHRKVGVGKKQGLGRCFGWCVEW